MPKKAGETIAEIGVDVDAVFRHVCRDIDALGEESPSRLAPPGVDYTPSTAERVLVNSLAVEFARRLAESQTGGLFTEPEQNKNVNPTFDAVSKEIRDRYTRYFPASNKSRHACLARFKNAALINRGEYGSVYDVVDDGSRYAVKVVEFDSRTSAHFYNNIVEEVEITKLMGNEGIGPAVEAVYWCEQQSSMTVMIVMELATLGDIDMYARNNMVTFDMYHQLRGILDEMHAHGVCHNDLHPGNILVTAANGGRGRRRDGRGAAGGRDGVKLLISDYGMATKNKMCNRDRDMHAVREMQRRVVELHVRAVLEGYLSSGRLRLSLGENIFIPRLAALGHRGPPTTKKARGKKPPQAHKENVP